MARLSAVGLNTVPAWLKPWQALSLGQKARASLARSVNNGSVHDEFTSMLDRHVAKSLAVAVSRFVHKAGFQGVLMATWCVLHGAFKCSR